jgi:hypothetical protein
VEDFPLKAYPPPPPPKRWNWRTDLETRMSWLRLGEEFIALVPNGLTIQDEAEKRGIGVAVTALPDDPHRPASSFRRYRVLRVLH